MMRVRASIGASGAPLSMIGLVLAAWVSGRALLWDKALDREALAAWNEARVPQQPYVYQTKA